MVSDVTMTAALPLRKAAEAAREEKTAVSLIYVQLFAAVILAWPAASLPLYRGEKTPTHQRWSIMCKKEQANTLESAIWHSIICGGQLLSTASESR